MLHASKPINLSQIESLQDILRYAILEKRIYENKERNIFIQTFNGFKNGQQAGSFCILHLLWLSEVSYFFGDMMD